MSEPIYVSEDCNLVNLLKKSKSLVSVVMFTAVWCNPCKRIKEAIHKSLYKEAQFYLVDIDKCPKTAEQYKISGIPTFKFFVKGGKELLDGFSGSNVEKLLNIINMLKEEEEEKEIVREKETADKMFSSSDFP